MIHVNVRFFNLALTTESLKLPPPSVLQGAEHRSTKDPNDKFKLHDYVSQEVKGASCCRS